MKKSFLFGSWLAGFALVLPVLEEPKENPQIQDRIKALHEAYRKNDDNAALQAIDALTQLATSATSKEKTKIASALEDSYELRREDNKLFIAVAMSLSTLGEEGAKPLINGTAHKNFKRPGKTLAELRAEFAKAAGKTKSLKIVDSLIDLMKDRDYVVMAGAANGLGNYRKAPEATRKQIVDQLVKHVSTAEVAKSANPGDAEAKLKYDTIGAEMITSLQSLTGENIREPAEWVKWWNANRKTTWKSLP